MNEERLARVVLAASVWLWVLAVVFAPGAVFPIGHFICHQRPERSFFIHARQMPVCARCTGIYLGATLAGPLAIIASAAIAASRARAVLFVAALPTAVTWTLEFFGVAHFSNAARCLAGLPLGFAAAWLVLSELRSPRAAR